jgi:F0F1-type ATP synthase assembly protein I
MTGDQRPDSDWSGMGTGWSITSTLIAGMLVCGFIGYLADRVTGLHQVFLPIGIVLGGAVGVYIVYLRYGRGNDGER